MGKKSNGVLRRSREDAQMAIKNGREDNRDMGMWQEIKKNGGVRDEHNKLNPWDIYSSFYPMDFVRDSNSSQGN